MRTLILVCPKLPKHKAKKWSTDIQSCTSRLSHKYTITWLDFYFVVSFYTIQQYEGSVWRHCRNRVTWLYTYGRGDCICPEDNSSFSAPARFRFQLGIIFVNGLTGIIGCLLDHRRRQAVMRAPSDASRATSCPSSHFASRPRIGPTTPPAPPSRVFVSRVGQSSPWPVPRRFSPQFSTPFEFSRGVSARGPYQTPSEEEKKMHHPDEWAVLLCHFTLTGI